MGGPRENKHTDNNWASVWDNLHDHVKEVLHHHRLSPAPARMRALLPTLVYLRRTNPNPAHLKNLDCYIVLFSGALVVALKVYSVPILDGYSCSESVPNRLPGLTKKSGARI
jgi:hypothetical protein